MSVSSNLDDSLLAALVSGTTTSAIVSTLTYPLDLIKTQQQLNNYVAMAKYKIPSNGPSTIAQLFKGGSALVIGNVLKNSVRIFSYHWASNFMALEVQDSDGKQVRKSTAPRIVIAGIMSGFLETLWIIPFENIKITMIQNMSLRNEVSRVQDAGLNIDVTGHLMPDKHHKPAQNVFSKHYVSPHAYFTSDLIQQFKGGKNSRFASSHLHRHTKKDGLKTKFNQSPSLTFFGTIREIYSLKGLRGFTNGTLITMVRQVGISTIWLSSYNWSRQLIAPTNKNDGWFGGNHTLIQALGLHFVATGAVILSTQPLDVVKTYRQAKNSEVYRDSLRTAYHLFVHRGFRTLFAGALPRGIKVLVSGGLSATIYAYFEKLTTAASSKTVFSSDG